MENMDISAFNYYFEYLNNNSEQIIEFTKELKKYANSKYNKEHIYVIQSALSDSKEYPYLYEDAIIILIPRYKILFLNLGDDCNEFNNYCQDVLDDLGALSKKYQYLQHIGRPRDWSEVIEFKNIKSFPSLKDIIESREQVSSPKEIRLIELLISLFTGSINDISKIGGLTIPESTLDKVKKKILLFDTTQNNFLYEKKKKKKKRLVIQGLSGTGKTELLLHKLKELYTDNDSDRICFTCHNKILASNLKKRITPFFNFMKVDSQIEWNERLWCHRAWGNLNDVHSGAYRYICHFYDIPFLNLSNVKDFGQVCKIALEKIEDEPSNNNKYAFDYMLIDESQDFSEEFFSLCERITKKRIYIAGDIFQSIFGTQTNLQGVDYLLNQCYRTEPKTLMFAHALGMGLFEDKKLQWPKDEEWKAYGYKINKSKSTTTNNYILTRTPIRRFEDLPSNNCIEFKNIAKNNDLNFVAEDIVSKILEIKENNSSLLPSDIAIILLNTNREYNSRVSCTIERVLAEKNITWKVNRAFETQIHIENELCITNHNNVKGLEFPFVICYSPNQLGENIKFRNAIYMALTRSFIKSILYIPVSEPIDKQYIDGLNNILERGEINCTEPTSENMTSIQNLNLDFDRTSTKSFKEVVYDAIDSLGMNMSEEGKSYYMDLILKLKGEIYDIEDIKQVIRKLREI